MPWNPLIETGLNRMDVSEQQVLRFVARAVEGSDDVELISTHASNIVLAGNKAYKLKRHVRFPYLDYSTPDRRLAACQTEFALNRRTAPEIYIGVHSITLSTDGHLAWNGAGQLVDAVLEMHRFDQDCLFDRMAQRGSLTPAIMTETAHRIAEFHEAAPVSLEHGGVQGIAAVLDINDRSLRATDLISAEAADDFLSRFQQALRRHASLLDERRLAGKVRRCHGDLTLRNICLFDGRPTLFDCIEFDESMATTDVLYDLAFLLMDLWHRDQRALANTVLNRYLDECDETDGLVLVPFFMAIRATVRAHVTAAQAKNSDPKAVPDLMREARQYYDLAQTLLAPSAPVLVAIGGFSGSGKSTVASLLAPYLGPAPGARLLNSDRLRKKIHGVPVQQKLPPSSYSTATSAEVYEKLDREACRALAGGCAVIADAVFAQPDERTRIERVAQDAQAPFHGFWLHASPETLTSRVTARRGGPSDADAEVVHVQLSRDAGAVSWTQVDASRDAMLSRDQILRTIDASRGKDLPIDSQAT
jgi:aminoglycoside phosphotransferase family enzyme/predicted kinase